jgi:hypothetical protein
VQAPNKYELVINLKTATALGIEVPLSLLTLVDDMIKYSAYGRSGSDSAEALTRDMQARVNPCAIIEFTATPPFNSNILHSVSAPELKTAEMIKLPIILAEHDSWQNAVNGAIASRAALENPRRREACSG